jgi:hypothetical protein
MGFDSKGLDDYIDVAQRIAEFRAKYPEGSLQPVNPQQPFDIRVVTGTDKGGKEQSGTFIIYAAAAYRTPSDIRPGIGCAYEVFPGRTPYTAGSELQNAETAAWGRAIVAALAADTRAGVASQQEVRNRQAERGDTAGDAWGNATPAEPRTRGQVSRPAQPASAPPAEEIDQDAQALADEAQQAVTLTVIEDIHRRAREAGHVGKLIRNPSSGGTGKLALYIDWRRKQVKDSDAAFADLQAAADKAGMAATDLEAHVREITGAEIEGATVAQLQQAAQALRDRQAAAA